jgi:predicted amidohydrolase/ribosomal protein S18 acetylase RimI-like enzyme
MPKIDLKKFEKKVLERTIRPEDFDAIIKLQQACFPGMKTWSKEQLMSHHTLFPEGQLCVEYSGKIIGSCASLIVDFDEYSDQHTWTEITDNGFITNHDPEGYNLYGMEIMVHPDYRRMKIGQRLYDARKELARELNLKSIIIGGRIPNYHKYAEKMTPRQYIEEVIHGNIYDPVLTFQLKNGFNVIRMLTNYLPGDKESRTYATLAEWNNVEYEPKTRRHFKTSFPVRLCVIQYMMRKINSFEEFAGQCEYFADVASGYNSDFAVFPELLSVQLLSFIEEKRPEVAIRQLAKYTDKYLELFTGLSVRHNINIIGGSHIVEEDNRLYNISFLFRRDGTIEKQYKIHITPNEKRWWGIEPGSKIEVFDTDCGKIAIQICYDIEFPEMARIATERGARIIFTPFCTEDRQGYLRVRYCAQARAVENQIYTIIAGTVGNLPEVQNMDIQYAQSGIFTPSDFSFPRDGIADECSPNVETVIIADVDLELLKRHRRSGSVVQLRDRREDLYEVRSLK